MPDRELSDINNSGELTNIQLGEPLEEAFKLLVKSAIEDLIGAGFGNFSFFDNDFLLNSGTIITGGPGAVLFTEEQQRSGMYVITDNYVDITANNNVDPPSTLRLNTGTSGATLPTTEIADITEAKQVVTKEWVDNKVTGASGSFTTNDGKTVTVVDGLITTIV